MGGLSVQMSISTSTLSKYIRPGSGFLETGSRWGTTLYRAIEAGAVVAAGCETDSLYCGIANTMLSELCPRGNARVIHCASEVMLKTEYVVATVFLDAHTQDYSPVLVELSLIGSWHTKPNHILIDDMRLMRNWGVEKDSVMSALSEMGYELSREDGVMPMDILVGTKHAGC